MLIYNAYYRLTKYFGIVNMINVKVFNMKVCFWRIYHLTILINVINVFYFTFFSLKIARQGTPPPQRPTSPDPKTRPSSSLSVKKANDWLGGGRDLYWESIQKRPMSGHIPGWKEGLPDSMKRPRSAVAARTLNRLILTLILLGP